MNLRPLWLLPIVLALLGADTRLRVAPPAAGGGLTYETTVVTEIAANQTSHVASCSGTSIQDGDLLLMVLCTDGGGSMDHTCPTATTWTEIVENNAGGVNGSICGRIASSEPACDGTDYTWTSAASQHSITFFMVFDGANETVTNHLPEFAGDASGTDDTPISPALSPTPAAGSMVLRAFCANAGSLTTEDAGFPPSMQVNIATRETSDGDVSGPVTGGVALDTNGNTGTATWAALDAAQEWSSFSLEIVVP